MSKLPKISIVTPSFNQADFLERTIKSILQQNYPDLEYMIMDGGSTDDSVDIIKKYADNLDYWRSCPDKGQGDTIWQAIQKSSGDIFAWLNSDDIYLPGTLDFVGRYFAEHPNHKILAGNCLRIAPNGRILSKPFGAPTHSVRSMVFWGCFCLQPAVFWRRDLLLQAGPINPNLVATFDTEFAIRYTKLAKWHKVERYLAGIRIHEQAKTTRLRELAVTERSRFLKDYGYNDVNRVIRFALRAFYRSRYEIQRFILNRPGNRNTIQLWTANSSNADPV